MSRSARLRDTSVFALLAVAALAQTAAAARTAQTRAFDGDRPAPANLRECGTEFTPEQGAAYLRMLQERGPVARGGIDPPYYIPIKAHIIRQSDGTGGLSAERLEQAIADANGHYATTGIVFYRLGDIDWIDSDAWYSTDTLDEIDDMRSTNLAPNAINIYFTEFLDYESGALCGISAFTFSAVQAIAMRNSCTANPAGLGNHSTFSHEIGHYFNLFHTHEPFYGDEYVDGSNCTVAGDLVCDTPADPTLGSSNVSSACNYTGSAVDGHGDPYVPDPSQLMSYSLKHCRDNFSTGSLDRIVDTLLSERLDLLSNPVSAPAVAAGPSLAEGAEVALAAPRPNPTTGRTQLSFALGVAATVELTLHDVRGAAVRTLAAGPREAGTHTVEWDGRDASGRDVSPGIYFARLTAAGRTAAQKVQLVR